MVEFGENNGNGSPKPADKWQPKKLSPQQRTALLASALGASVDEAASVADYHPKHVYKLLATPEATILRWHYRAIMEHAARDIIAGKMDADAERALEEADDGE
jgi:hypothetical protein